MKRFRGHLAVTLTDGLEESVTPWAGVSLLVETYRRYGVGAAAERALPNPDESGQRADPGANDRIPGIAERSRRGVR